MTSIYSFTDGELPLLVSIPHDGRALMPGQAERMTEAGRALPDTDWFVRDLYAFCADMGASVIAANYSRYVVDLNRPANDASLYQDQVSTGLCPLSTFAGQPLYIEGETITPREQEERIAKYWLPYHDRISATLDALRARHGFALLWDAHSIASAVPALFPGVLPDFNIGTNDGKSCGAACESAVIDVADASPFSTVSNGRFKGGYITRHYGDPEKDTHAIQLELSQRSYMDENNLSYDAELAVRVSATIRGLLAAFIRAAEDRGNAD
jgi:N-formylglutamate amidohydrolase